MGSALWRLSQVASTLASTQYTTGLVLDCFYLYLLGHGPTMRVRRALSMVKRMRRNVKAMA